jgi:hypothetical protein
MSHEPRKLHQTHCQFSFFVYKFVILSRNEYENWKSCQCEIRLVLKFLNAKNVCPAEVYWQVCEVYGENATSDGMVRRWCRMFSEGRTNVHDDRSGRPSLVTVDLLDQVNEKIRENIPCTPWLSSFSPLKEIFSGRMIQQQWWGEDSRAALGQNIGGRLLRQGHTGTCAPIWQMSVWVAIMWRSS